MSFTDELARRLAEESDVRPSRQIVDAPLCGRCQGRRLRADATLGESGLTVHLFCADCGIGWRLKAPATVNAEKANA